MRFRLGVALVLAGACGGEPPAPQVPAAEVETSESFRAYRFVELLGRPPRGLVPLAAHAGQWHWRLYGPEDAPTLIEQITPSGRVHQTTKVRNESGALVLETLDARRVLVDTLTWNGDTVVRKKRDGVVEYEGASKVRVVFDARGRAEELRYLGHTGQPVFADEGCATVRRVRDEEGRVKSRKCFGADGSPATFESNAHEEASTYGAEGLVARIAYRSATGEPVLDEEGCAARAFLYDGTGAQREATCLDAGGTKTATRSGWATTRWTWSARGCETKREYLDRQGALVDVRGFATLTYGRDEHCDWISWETRDKRGHLAAQDHKPAMVDVTRDREGKVVRRRCRSQASAPVDCTFAYVADGSVLRYAYDDKGRELSVKAYDEGGAPSKAGHDWPHEQRRQYGADGRESAALYFDEFGKPAPGLGGVVERTFEYDPMGALVSQKHWGPGRVAVEPTTKCHELRYGYDATHRLSSIACMNASGAPAQSDLCLSGVCWPTGSARVDVVRSKEGVANVFRGTKGEEISRVDCAQKACNR